MSHLVILDAGVLGLAANPKAGSEADRCRDRLAELVAVGLEILMPEIADYEVRRDLVLKALPKTRPAILKRLATLPSRPTPSLCRLDLLRGSFGFLPISTVAMLRAAEYWALLRRTDRATAGPWDLDADCILAGQAMSAGNLGDRLTIATTNNRHLVRFPGVDARTLETIIT